jgi:hypothetical protein
MSVFKNISKDSAIEFAGRTDIETSNNPDFWKSYPSDVAVTDFDADGKLDIVIANFLEYYDDDDYYFTVISVFRNTGINGTISFATQKDYETRDELLSITLGDLNGDKRQDIVTVQYGGYGGSYVSIFENDSIKDSISFEKKRLRYRIVPDERCN